MKIIIDTEAQRLTCEDGDARQDMPLYSKEAFELLSQQWVKVGWDQKYSYTFSWMGMPIIQLPEDMIRMQEVIFRVRPDVIVETGVAHGGSLVYYASLCKALGRGRVIGVDIEIRQHNRASIESHALASFITLVEGDSVSTETVANVRSRIAPHERVLVILDSCHTKGHVSKELAAYRDLVTEGSYIVATDGIMKELHDVPHGEQSWQNDHPTAAAIEFAESQEGFVLEQPSWPFNESELESNVTHWPSAYLRRVA